MAPPVQDDRSPRERSSFDQDELESRLAWIFGSTRSGSTWLLRMLCHPLKLENRGPLGFSLPQAAGSKRPLDALAVNEFLLGYHLAPRSGDPTRLVNGQYVPATFARFFSAHPGYVMSSEFEQTWRPELRRLALVRLHALQERAAAELAVADRPTIVIKDVGVSDTADETMRLLPRSRLLFLVRDGRDVIDSLVHAALPGSWFSRAAKPLIASETDRLDFIRRKAVEWACATDSCRRAWVSHPAELRRVVRYETLLADPATELSSLCSWLGLDRPDERIRAAVDENAFGRGEATGPAEFARAATPGLWRRNLSSEEQATIAEIVGDRLEELGYRD